MIRLLEIKEHCLIRMKPGLSCFFNYYLFDDNNSIKGDFSCKDFNAIGSAKNLDELLSTEFTQEQFNVFKLIMANYAREIEAGTHGVAGKEALLIMMNAEQLNYSIANNLSISRHDCLLDDSKSLNQVAIYNFNTTFLDSFKKGLIQTRHEFEKLSETMPIVVDKATDLIKVEVKENAIIEYSYVLKNVSSGDTDAAGIASFVSGMKGQLIEDVCSGKSIQSEMMGFTVIYRYSLNDGNLIESFNLREIKLEHCD